ncbi:SSU1 [Candida pseudojiufengensis]|uniref:SSU1 n=1 Tax=Candida pseudojiufengensis TaxID=497109 RepID=UPI0022253B55|nr:SSU1 [Candida pseudojiufengensis]KAI5965268.1 SSU1 [Candida pseudojiufengensis]
MNHDLEGLNNQIAAPNSSLKSEDNPDKVMLHHRHLTIKEFLRKECIDDFHPCYFVGFLGCGITGNIFYEFPYPATWLKVFGIIFFCMTIFIFIITTMMLILSLIYYPRRFGIYVHDYNYSIYFAVYSMGFSTIINGIHMLTEGRYPIFLWTLFWIGAVLAVHNTAVIFFFSFLSKFSIHKLADINASIFMPVVCCCVHSSVGHRLGDILKTRNQKIITSVTSLMLFFISLLLFHGVGAVFMLRLILCKIPSTPQIFTQFLPIGFTGQSSYSIMLFGNNMYNWIPDESLGRAFLVSSALLSYALLAGSYIYMFIAIASCFSKSKPFAKNPDSEYTTKKFGIIKWNKGWWTMTFPTGTMSLCSYEISKGVAGYDLLFFKVMASIIGVALFIICTINVLGLLICIWAKFYDAFFIPLDDNVKEKV